MPFLSIYSVMDDAELLKKYNSIYLDVITRYKDVIEEGENLYIADLPRLVTPSDESVVLVSKEIKARFPAYDYEQSFADAARFAYDYVIKEITHISIPIQFWLRPSETIRYGAGDIFDKAVLLCSILVALGNPSSRIIVAVRENERQFAVYSEYKDRIIVMDLDKGMKEYQSREQLMGSMNIREDDDITAYEFNDNMYRDIV